MLEFEESGSATPIDIEEEEENGLDDDFFNIEERNCVDDDHVPEEVPKEGGAKVVPPKLSATAQEWVPPVRQWNSFEGSDMKWIKNDALFCQPESKYEVKTVDIAGNFWEYNAEKSYYQVYNLQCPMQLIFCLLVFLTDFIPRCFWEVLITCYLGCC